MLDLKVELFGEEVISIEVILLFGFKSNDFDSLFLAIFNLDCFV